MLNLTPLLEPKPGLGAPMQARSRDSETTPAVAETAAGQQRLTHPWRRTLGAVCGMTLAAAAIVLALIVLLPMFTVGLLFFLPALLPVILLFLGIAMSCNV